jgi:hypothetical protein
MMITPDAFKTFDRVVIVASWWHQEPLARSMAAFAAASAAAAQGDGPVGGVEDQRVERQAEKPDQGEASDEQH